MSLDVEYRISEENEFTMESIYTRKPMVALITGITGQDGSYLTELLLDKGYTVSVLNKHILSTIEMNLELV